MADDWDSLPDAPAVTPPSQAAMASPNVAAVPSSAKAPDDWDALPDATVPSNTWGGLAKQAALGVGRGVAGLAGSLGEAITAKPLRDLATAKESALSADPGQGLKAFNESIRKSPSYGSQISEAVGMEGANAPKTGAERIASGIGEGASGALLMGPEGILANTALGAIGGGAGRAAAEAVPEPYKPLAEIGGNLLGVGAGMGAARAGQAVASTASRLVQPLTESGRQTLAGRVLATRAADVDALRTSLESTAPREIVPGSQPTTFQSTGDMGLGSLEREVATKNPQEFMQRRAEQNAARLDQLSDLQATGNPQSVADTVRGRLNDVDQMTQAAVDSRLNEAQQRATALGGQHDQEVYGNSLRTILQDAETTARTHERGLWNAVDPDGDLTSNMVPVQRATQDVYGGLSQAAQATLKPIEQQVLGVIGKYNPIEPFKELTDLRSLVSSSMREELSQNGRTPAYARLSQLRGGIENSVNSAVANRAIADAVNVAAGKLAPEQSLASNIQRQVSEWQSARTSGQGAAVGVGEAGPIGAPAVSTAPRGQGAAGRGPENATGDQGLQGAPITANFDEAAANRLREASAATKQRAQTFGAEPMKGILRRQGSQGPYNLRETAVPAKVFHPGDTGFEDVSRYRAAVGDKEALPVLGDYAASSLRESALTPEGTIDPAKFARWQAQHAEALRAFPALKGRFSDAAAASEAVADAAALRKSAMDQAQQGVLGKIIGLNDPQDVTRTIGSMFGGQKSVGEIRNLVTQVRGNPAAMEGLRKAVADHITQKFVSNTEAAASGRPIIKADQFQSFIKNNETALSLIFKPEEIVSMKAVAADLQRANRSTTAVKIPGQSNTAQDLTALASKPIGQSWLSRIMADTAAAGAGFAISANPIVAFAAGAGAHVANAMRSAGFSKVEDLIKQAMLDPNMARALLSKVPPKGSPQFGRMLARRIVASSAAAEARANQQQGRDVQQRKRGGVVYDSAHSPKSRVFDPKAIGAKQARDGNWYLKDPKRPGKYLQVVEKRDARSAIH